MAWPGLHDRVREQDAIAITIVQAPQIILHQLMSRVVWAEVTPLSKGRFCKGCGCQEGGAPA